jgi:hypothetical protein
MTPYKVFGASTSSSASRAAQMITLEFATRTEAIDAACRLMETGRVVTHVDGPNDFTMSQDDVEAERSRRKELPAVTVRNKWPR